ncbi:MAG: 5-deoxy-glucuronate isomerase [Acidobacteria bacterium]|nr:MAG: 5-deoxy-glucuronate isomerase [Acidobacteriota bacterium]
MGDAGLRLADTLYRVPRAAGLHPIQLRGEGGARELSSWRLCLGAGEEARFVRPDEEAVLVVQEGAAELAAGDLEARVERRGVFSQRATALYLPPGLELRVRAGAPFEAILVATPAAPGSGPVLIRPPQVRVASRGKGPWQREVHDVLVADPHPRRLLVGETRNPPGHWSSFPPHKHDGADGEPRLEEVYHYRIEPPQGFAQQLLYAAGGESASHTVRDRDAVLLPYGYHPVAAAPGYRLYYLWALAGDERRLALYEDPDHRWLHDAG